MPIINKSKLFLKQETEEKINQLCVWIEQNCANPIGFEDLTRQSGFDVNELMTLFGVYKKTTPMGFVRFCREMEKRKKNSQSLIFFLAAYRKNQKTCSECSAGFDLFENHNQNTAGRVLDQGFRN